MAGVNFGTISFNEVRNASTKISIFANLFPLFLLSRAAVHLADADPTIGWDSRTQYPQYPGQLRLAVYANLAAGANMVEYWHWHSLHYGQETYWKGVLSHDLEPNHTYFEVTQVAGELKKIDADLVNLKKDNKIAILVSTDSANAILTPGPYPLT